MIEHVLRTACAARQAAPPVGDPAYQGFCRRLGDELQAKWPLIEKAGAADVQRAARDKLPSAITGRLRLGGPQRDHLAALTSVVEERLPEITVGTPAAPAAGAMTVRRIPKPLGVVFMVYEARPTVTVEGALLSVATGNAVILRGGKEIAAANAAFAGIISASLAAAGLPPGMVQILSDADRAQLRALLKRHDAIDVLIPRGSPSLIDYCRTASTIPVIASGGGVNHLYVHASADPAAVAGIALDSKLAEPTACNSLEMLLVDRHAAAGVVAALVGLGERRGFRFTLRVPPELVAPAGPCVTVEPLGEHDDGREFLDRSLAVRAVSGMAEAVSHIRQHGSGHTEGIAAADARVVDEFCRRVDAAAIVVNGSLRLHDGPTMRLGPEISISTGRLHVRGPVGLGSLLTYTWVIDGNGTLRTQLSDDAVLTTPSR
jgi:glutamate-5-semialdehyde dehydrogenase